MTLYLAAAMSLPAVNWRRDLLTASLRSIPAHTTSLAHQLTSSPAHQLTSSPAHRLPQVYNSSHQLTSLPAHQLPSSPAHQLSSLLDISSPGYTSHIFISLLDGHYSTSAHYLTISLASKTPAHSSYSSS